MKTFLSFWIAIGIFITDSSAQSTRTTKLTFNIDEVSRLILKEASMGEAFFKNKGYKYSNTLGQDINFFKNNHQSAIGLNNYEGKRVIGTVSWDEPVSKAKLFFSILRAKGFTPNNLNSSSIGFVNEKTGMRYSAIDLAPGKMLITMGYFFDGARPNRESE